MESVLKELIRQRSEYSNITYSNDYNSWLGWFKLAFFGVFLWAGIRFELFAKFCQNFLDYF